MRIQGLMSVFLILTCTSCYSQMSPSTKLNSPESGEPANIAELRALLLAVPPPLSFRAGDTLAVRVYGISDYQLQERIPADGMLDLPLAGSVMAAGVTEAELQKEIAAKLVERGMVKNPQVTVVAISQPWAIVTVSGAVSKSGTFPALGNLTVADYLSEAGGFVDNSPGSNGFTTQPADREVTLNRPSVNHSIKIPLGMVDDSQFSKIPLFPGDELRVDKAGLVYAVGAFKSQGGFPLKGNVPTSVLQLVALAGGIGYEADRADAHIIRSNGTTRILLSVDVSRILRGTSPDVNLQAEDILFVPTNLMKAGIKGGGANVIVSLASSYLIAR